MRSVWQRVARLNKTLMSSSSISTSGMSRTWSELVVSASKLNIAKYSKDVVKPAAPSIAAAASVIVFPMSINNLNIFMELLVGHHHAHRGFCCWGRWCCEIKLSRRRDGVGVAVILLQQGRGELKRETEGCKRHGRNQKRLLWGEWATTRIVQAGGSKFSISN